MLRLSDFLESQMLTVFTRKKIRERDPVCDLEFRPCALGVVY